jgi:hypothetical protein
MKTCHKFTNLKRGAITRDEILHKQRRALHEGPGVIFVYREEFCQLLLSFRKLIRANEPAVRLRGLLDVKSGNRYLIAQEELFVGCS